MQDMLYNIHIFISGRFGNDEFGKKINSILEPWSEAGKCYYKSKDVPEYKEILGFLNTKCREEFGIPHIPRMQINITKSRVFQELTMYSPFLSLSKSKEQEQEPISYVIAIRGRYEPEYRYTESNRPFHYRAPEYLAKYELVQIGPERVYDDFRTHAEKHFKFVKHKFERNHEELTKKQRTSE